MSYSTLVPEILNPAEAGAMLWVFEVPARSTPSPTTAAR